MGLSNFNDNFGDFFARDIFSMIVRCRTEFIILKTMGNDFSLFQSLERFSLYIETSETIFNGEKEEIFSDLQIFTRFIP